MLHGDALKQVPCNNENQKLQRIQKMNKHHTISARLKMRIFLHNFEKGHPPIHSKHIQLRGVRSNLCTLFPKNDVMLHPPQLFVIVIIPTGLVIIAGFTLIVLRTASRSIIISRRHGQCLQSRKRLTNLPFNHFIVQWVSRCLHCL